MFTRKKTMLIILQNAAKVIGAGVLAVLFIGFSSGQIAKISNSIFEQRATAFILEKRNDAISQLKKDFGIIGSSDEMIEKAFPPADNILDFIGAMETLANQNSIPQSISFGALGGDYINYSIQLGSNLSIFMNYLKNFEKLPYFTLINSINLTNSGDWTRDSSISIGAKLYTTPVE